MKKISIIMFFFLSLFWYVYASVTIAWDNKWLLPWQWTPNWHYDSAHNVWNSYSAESRFSFELWSSVWTWSVVKDSVTWLIWQSKSDHPDAWNVTYSMADSYCSDLVIWIYTDWRLPNIKEMHSVLDFTRSWPAMDINYFEIDVDHPYWTSTDNIQFPWSKLGIASWLGSSTSWWYQVHCIHSS